jgi:hypothetical protein
LPLQKVKLDGPSSSGFSELAVKWPKLRGDGIKYKLEGTLEGKKVIEKTYDDSEVTISIQGGGMLKLRVQAFLNNEAYSNPGKEKGFKIPKPPLNPPKFDTDTETDTFYITWESDERSNADEAAGICTAYGVPSIQGDTISLAERKWEIPRTLDPQECEIEVFSTSPSYAPSKKTLLKVTVPPRPRQFKLSDMYIREAEEYHRVIFDYFGHTTNASYSTYDVGTGQTTPDDSGVDGGIAGIGSIGYRYKYKKHGFEGLLGAGGASIQLATESLPRVSNYGRLELKYHYSALPYLELVGGLGFYDILIPNTRSLVPGTAREDLTLNDIELRYEIVRTAGPIVGIKSEIQVTNDYGLLFDAYYFQPTSTLFSFTNSDVVSESFEQFVSIYGSYQMSRNSKGYAGLGAYKGYYGMASQNVSTELNELRVDEIVLRLQYHMDVAF